MIKCQGEDISFSIEVVNQDGSAGNINRYTNVILLAKSGCHVVKYSVTEKPGHLPLEVSGDKLTGIIDGNNTNQMLGDLEFELTTEELINGKTEVGIMPQENSGLKIIKPS